MNKVTDKPVQISDKRFRYSFRIYHDPSSIEDGSRDKALYSLLQTLTDQIALLRCGPGYPDKMAIYHDGSQWIVTGESEGEVP